jgi:hypothetical protein
MPCPAEPGDAACFVSLAWSQMPLLAVPSVAMLGFASHTHMLLRSVITQLAAR